MLVGQLAYLLFDLNIIISETLNLLVRYRQFSAGEKHLRRYSGEDAIAGAFEELPALLVILIGISLFSVSFAHATTTRDDFYEYQELQEDCLDFAGMVRGSETLCGKNSQGTFDSSRLSNETGQAFIEEFNSTLMGFEYRVSVQVIGNGSSVLLQSSEIPELSDTATFHTCANVDVNGRIEAARISVSIWRSG